VPLNKVQPLGNDLAQSTALAGTREGADAPAGRPKVLVVDDERFMRDLLKLHLTNHGYDVRLAEDAITAGYALLREKPDLVIVDVEMPYMNGYEFVAALKADPATRDLPVIFLTSDKNVAVQANKLGAAAYLNKPVMADNLLRVVQRNVRATSSLRSSA
jgi:CheY-like chemotaxis protein